MFSLSTVWNADKFQDGRDIVEGIAKLGIRSIELNFSLSARIVEEIAACSRQKGIGISSLHNYCPFPSELKPESALPDAFSLSSVFEDERKKAVEYTRITIDTAQRLGAGAVVLHSGRVEIEDKTRFLIDLYNRGLAQGPEYQDVRDAFIRERKKKAPDYFAQCLKSLAELCAFAQKAGIVLGVENRFYYREIPSEEEFAFIFDKFKAKPIAYWHDVGHSCIFEGLGFIQEGALLKKYGARMRGTHLHNVNKMVDHQAPIRGDFDFSKLSRYARPETIKVIEVHKHVPAQDIIKSIEYLSGIFAQE